mmetsp:Transcript_15784/g.36354  ORF Transcript_15784/g.36354 Transcript_15784/m.36354 type:complete len:121 (+) Transcript_15784:91-453(+)
MSSSGDAVVSAQGRRRATESLQRLYDFIATTVHTLNLVTRVGDGMTKWGHGAFKSFREAIYPFISHPEKYTMRSGDQRPDDDINTTGNTCPPLTTGYIEAIANRRNLDDYPNEPVLQVLS